MSDTIKFLTEFRKRLDAFMGAVVEVEKFDNAKKEETDETILKAFDIMSNRKLKEARTAWMDLQELEHKFMSKFDL